MRALLATALCLIGLSSYGQPLIRQFFTTNPAPIVDVVAGSNATVQASTPNAQTRRFTVNAIPAAGTGQTNNTIVVAGTNIVVTSVSAGGDTTYTVYGLTDTNVISLISTNIAAYQALLATNNYAVIATNIAAYQAYLATNNYAVIATNIAAYQAEIATNGYAPIATNIAAYQAYLATNTFVPGSLSPGLSNTFVLKSGDTVSGPILTTSTSSNAPAQNELATGGWVRSLFNNGVIDYVTTNIDGVATNLGSPNQFVYQFWQGVIPQPSTRVWVSAFLTNNGYVGSVITTNTFSFLAGPVAINSYLGLSSGGGDALTVHPEIYYSYDKTNWYGDWEAQGQALTPGRTNLYQFIISFPAITATNSSGFYLQRRFKVNSAGGTPTLYVLVGTNNSSGTLDASHISFSGPNSAIGNAYLANNQTFTGSNQFSGGMMVWGDPYKTNGVWIGPGGEVLSNNLGSVTISAGNVTASGQFTGKSALTNAAGYALAGKDDSTNAAFYAAQNVAASGVTNAVWTFIKPGTSITTSTNTSGTTNEITINASGSGLALSTTVNVMTAPNVSAATVRHLAVTGSPSSSTVTDISAPWPNAATFTNLYVKALVINAGTNVTFTIYTNGVASNLAATLSGTGGSADTGTNIASSVTVPAGTKISVGVSHNCASTIAASFFMWSFQTY